MKREDVFFGAFSPEGREITMRRSGLFIMLLAPVALMLSIAPASASSEANTGDLLVALAHSNRLPAGNAEIAAQSLRSAGYAVPQIDLTARLTERNVVEVGRAMGLNLTTSRPDAPFSSSQVDSFVASFASSLDGRDSSGSNQTRGADPLEKGKGLKKGLYKSRSEPL
jgi:hypothetical protein